MTLRSRLAALVGMVVVVPLLFVAVGVIVWIDEPLAALLMIVLLAIAGAATLLVSWGVDRWAAGPVAEMVAAAEEVSAGRIGGVEPVVATGAAEVQQLTQAFNAMVRTMRAQMVELERGRLEFRRAVDRVGDALESTHDRFTIVDVLTETSLLTLRAQASIFWASHGRSLQARAAHGADALSGVTLQWGEGIAGTVAAQDRGVLAPAGVGAATCEPLHDDAVAVPMRRKGGLYGVLAVYGREPGRPFTPDDMHTLAALVRQAEAAVDNTYLHEEANRLSLTDGLTGAWNRRQLELRIRQELERASRFGEPFSVVMVDIDHFKDVNDRHGHQVGDAVLVELTRRLDVVSREVDSVARYGGEEFVILLPKTGLDGGARMAEKVRGAVAFEPFSADGATIDVTVSVGVATYPDHGGDAKEAIRAADEAMYRAKAAGRNRVMVAARHEPDDSGPDGSRSDGTPPDEADPDGPAEETAP